MRKGLLLPFALFLLGVFILLDNNGTITGAFAGTTSPIGNVVIGLYAILVSSFLLATGLSGLEHKLYLKSAIKNDPALVRLAEDAASNQRIGLELDHLVKELSKGNFEAGLGRPGHVDGTDVFYLRGRNGARLYYHQVNPSTYEIVAKSAKGNNQDRVIRKVREDYKKNLF